ncbi:FHA domain-containing protein [Leisingera sp. S232]|uniref:FHA domain-containing protein n=1 Tax=Leisingera sp. S232 TaxID=3415132 RepID=UPI003C7C06FD
MVKAIWFSAVKLFLGLGLLLASQAGAQDFGMSPSRVPEKGVAILDCAPSAPAPENSCVIRVPAGHKLEKLSSSDLGNREAAFKIARSASDLPQGLVLSSTIVLIDLSRGANSGRLRSWERERAAIEAMLSRLSMPGELAVYGFGAELVRISDFSSDSSAAVTAVRQLELSENNTILTSNILAAIEVLEGREDALFKNIILVSDGDEEGVGTFDDVADAAARENVSLSALGMFWRPEGNSASSRGLDVLGRITAPQGGLNRSVFLAQRGNEQAQAQSFAALVSTSAGQSGLILADGRPAPAQITVEMRVPEPGQDSATRLQTYKVEFSPAEGTANPDLLPEKAEESLMFGFPALYVYISAGGIGFLVLVLLFFLLRSSARSGQDDLMPQDEDADLEIAAGQNPHDTAGGQPLQPIRVPSSPVAAYLLRLDTGEKLPVSGERLSIGRSSSNGIVLSDHGISRVHAELFKNRDGGYSISDLESLNGTFVNEQKVSGTVRLRIGDTVGLGKNVRTKLVLP